MPDYHIRVKGICFLKGLPLKTVILLVRTIGVTIESAKQIIFFLPTDFFTN